MRNGLSLCNQQIHTGPCTLRIRDFLIDAGLRPRRHCADRHKPQHHDKSEKHTQYFFHLLFLHSFALSRSFDIRCLCIELPGRQMTLRAACRLFPEACTAYKDSQNLEFFSSHYKPCLFQMQPFYGKYIHYLPLKKKRKIQKAPFSPFFIKKSTPRMGDAFHTVVI